MHFALAGAFEHACIMGVCIKGILSRMIEDGAKPNSEKGNKNRITGA